MWLFYLQGTGIVVDESSKDPFSFEDIFNSSFKPKSFDVHWIKGIGLNHGQRDDGTYDPFQERMRLLASNTVPNQSIHQTYILPTTSVQGNILQSQLVRLVLNWWELKCKLMVTSPTKFKC